MLTILLPAAGQSSRMRGGDKLQMDVQGVPCLRAMAMRALKLTDQVIITVPDTSHPRAKTLEGLPITIVTVPDAHSGMSASLRAGASAAPKSTTGLMILPADMPDITAHDMAQLWALFEASGTDIMQAATPSGTPGHPVIFAAKLLPSFQTLTGDTGAAKIIKANAKSHMLFPLADDRALTDLDTPEQWAAWHQTTT